MLRINPIYPLTQFPAGQPSYNFDAIGEGFDVAFTAETADPITTLGFSRMRPVGSPGTYRLSIQGVDRSNFRSDGVEVAGVDVISNPSLPAGGGDPAGFVWHDLPTPVSLTPGGFYTFVYRAASGTWDGSNYERTYPVSYWPGSSSSWPSVTTYQNGGAVWRGSQAPVFGYRTATRTYGRPTLPTVGAGITYTGNCYDLSAKYHGITAKLSDVRAIYLKNNPATLGTAEIQVRVDPEGDNTLVATSIEIPFDPPLPQTNLGYCWHFPFLDPPEIDLGTPFSVVINSKTTAGTPIAFSSITVADEASWVPFDGESGVRIGRLNNAGGGPASAFNYVNRMAIELNLIDLRGTLRQTAFSPYLSGRA